MRHQSHLPDLAENDHSQSFPSLFSTSHHSFHLSATVTCVTTSSTLSIFFILSVIDPLLHSHLMSLHNINKCVYMIIKKKKLWYLDMKNLKNKFTFVTYLTPLSIFGRLKHQTTTGIINVIKLVHIYTM